MNRLLIFLLLNILLLSCKKESTNLAPTNPLAPFFAVYPAPVKGYVGDVMPFYDNNTFHLFFLMDWRDNAPQYHPWYKFNTTDLLNYTYQGQMIGLGTADQQDYTLGTGSVIKEGSTFYGYYTGHNYLFLNTSRPQEGILYATSPDLNKWAKKPGFLITPPAGYDFNNFRDPDVFFNDLTNEYWMVVGARKNNAGTLVYYTTKDLSSPNWVLQGDFYAPGSYDMMECPDVFKWGNYWYLVFSDTNAQNATHYRYSSSPSGPWTTPASDLLDSRFFYAAKTTFDGKNRYLFGWVPTKSGFSDDGIKDFAGNMSSHLLVQNADGTLSVTLPPAIENAFYKENTATISAKSSDEATSGIDYQLNSTSDLSYALFGNLKGSMVIKTTVNFAQAPQSFGFLLGAHDVSKQTYHLGFQNGNAESDRINSGTSSTEASLPFPLNANTNYSLKIVIENSIATIYINGQSALSTRIYEMQNADWGIYSSNGAVTFKNLTVYTLK
ncbi:MAG: glycoside hydrolase domain-containing protein [Mucilaginibacter sp.]